MQLYAKITTDTGKVVGKGANKWLDIEVVDGKQTIVFTKRFTTLCNTCFQGHNGQKCIDKNCPCELCN